MKFPQNKWNRENPTDKAYFAYHLLKHQDEESFEAEIYRYKLIYGDLEKYPEIPICVSLVGLNPEAKYA